VINIIYEILPSEFFLRQLDNLSKESLKLIKNKILFLKINPYRYKRIHYQNLFLFRIRFKDKRKEKRIIYLIEKSKIKILCILDRSKNYSDLEKYLKT
jgi:mRNA-degrading endonuclease RelE of RelBE toxin-antitoxin system